MSRSNQAKLANPIRRKIPDSPTSYDVLDSGLVEGLELAVDSMVGNKPDHGGHLRIFEGALWLRILG